MAKRFLFFIFLFSLCKDVCSQQLAQYTMYSFNHFGINPAAPGDQKCINAKIAYRTQWVHFDNNPITQFLSLQAPIKPKNRNFRKGYSSVGLYIENDLTGPTKYRILPQLCLPPQRGARNIFICRRICRSIAILVR